jgi:hypothetical protein
MICTMVSTEDFVLLVSVLREPTRNGEWGMSFFRGRQDDGGGELVRDGRTAYVGRSDSDRHN